MARNAEVTRQWKLLREIEASRNGKTIEELAEIGSVCSRTIRRDLEALQEAGFTLYDEVNEGGGKKVWKLDSRPFRNLDTSFTLPELAALYFSRALLESALQEPFAGDLNAAFTRLDTALSPRMREFLGELPQVLTARRAGGHADADPEVVNRLTAAALGRRKAIITYHSFSSHRVKQYDIEPYRLVFAEGSLYLLAFVPAYGQMRTFAIRRIKKLTVLEETFNAVQHLASQPFKHSFGVNVGEPQHVEIEFAAHVAPYVKEREWHESQRLEVRPDGSMVMSLDVCLDRPLVSWVLGFGPFARVLAPPLLAEHILEEIEEAREVYVPSLSFASDSPGDSMRKTATEPALPFARSKLRRQPA